jgi:hypothetical protein
VGRSSVLKTGWFICTWMLSVWLKGTVKFSGLKIVAGKQGSCPVGGSLGSASGVVAKANQFIFR